MCSTSRIEPVRWFAGMAAARWMLLESAVNAEVAPATWRNLRRLTSGMSEGPLPLRVFDRTEPLDGLRAEGVFQEHQTSGKGLVALV